MDIYCVCIKMLPVLSTFETDGVSITAAIRASSVYPAAFINHCVWLFYYTRGIII